MKPAAGIADPLDEDSLDEAVHVLVGSAHERWIGSPLFEDLSQALLDCAGVRRRQHPGAGQGARPGDAPGHVVFEQPSVEPERRPELERRSIGRGVETAGPERGHAMTGSRFDGGESWQPLISHPPSKSFSVTVPETRSWLLATASSSVRRAGANQSPRSMRPT